MVDCTTCSFPRRPSNTGPSRIAARCWRNLVPACAGRYHSRSLSRSKYCGTGGSRSVATPRERPMLSRCEIFDLSEILPIFRRIHRVGGARMVPVPFAGHLGYDAIFIVTYSAWLLFEIVTGKSRKSADPSKARDRGSFRFLIAMIWAGAALAFTFCFGLQRAAIPWVRTELFFG